MKTRTAPGRSVTAAVLVVGLVLPFLLITKASPAETTEWDETLSRTESVYGKAQDMSMDFVQKTRLEGFDDRTSSGRLTMKKPGQARWDYRKPVKQQIFVSEKKITLFDPGKRQAVVQNLSAHSDAEPAMGLLSDIGSWRTLFDVHPYPQEHSVSATITLEMVPHKMKSLERVLVTLNKDTGIISRLTIQQQEGVHVTFVLSNLRLDQGLKNDLFHFKIPRDVEVMELP
jgi:outer membrane lipoprotein carrier protein